MDVMAITKLAYAAADQPPDPSSPHEFMYSITEVCAERMSYIVR
jgi:hypothetical protein